MSRTDVNWTFRLEAGDVYVGSPVAYKIYPATHIWDWPEIPKLGWKDVAYDPEVTEQSARDTFAFLDKELKTQKSGD